MPPPLVCGGCGRLVLRMDLLLAVYFYSCSQVGWLSLWSRGPQRLPKSGWADRSRSAIRDRSVWTGKPAVPRRRGREINMTARVGTRERSHARHVGVAASWLHLRRVVGYACWRPAVRCRWVPWWPWSRRCRWLEVRGLGTGAGLVCTVGRIRPWCRVWRWCYCRSLLTGGVGEAFAGSRSPTAM